MIIRQIYGNFRLEELRKRCMFNSLSIDDYFWELFNYQEKCEVIPRNEGIDCIENKKKHNDNLWFYPHVANKRFMNRHGKYK